MISEFSMLGIGQDQKLLLFGHLSHFNYFIIVSCRFLYLEFLIVKKKRGKNAKSKIEKSKTRKSRVFCLPRILTLVVTQDLKTLKK